MRFYSSPIILKMEPATCGLGVPLQFTGYYFDRIPKKAGIMCTFSDNGKVDADSHLAKTHQQFKTSLVVEKVKPRSAEKLLSQVKRSVSVASCDCPP